MRVKITYSVDFDDVPRRVSSLIAESLNELKTLSRQLEIATESTNPALERMQKIDDARRKMAAVDSVLEDCYSILAGYNKALADMKMPQGQQDGTTNTEG